MPWMKRYQNRLKQPIKQKKQRRIRSYVVLAGLILFSGAIGWYLFEHQVLNARSLKAKATSTRQQSASLYSRGRILDRNNVILAQDSIHYDLYAHPQYYWGISPQQIAKAISPAIELPEARLSEMLAKPFSTIRLAKSLPKSTVNEILNTTITKHLQDQKTKKPLFKENGEALTKQIPVPGLDFVKKNVRKYPQGNLAAHVLGYLNDEAGISSGVEHMASAILKKEPLSVNRPTLDGRGHVIGAEQFNPESIVKIQQSEDVQLTIDAKLQYIAEEALEKGVQRAKAEKGSVVMMNPKTGEILAFALYPGYNPEQFLKADAKILKNFALSDVYPPGSTFKILTVACGLDTGVINKNSKILDTGRMKVGGWTIENYDYYRHPNPGNIDLTYLLQHSSNIASAKIAMKMNKPDYWDRMNRFGIGQKTNIDLPGESAGILQPYQKWDISTHASMGYGYGIASTPIQIAAAVSAIANKGVWVQPHVMKETTPIKRRRVISPLAAKETTDALKKSIAAPKTSTVRLESGIPLAGKTGTSKKPMENGRGYTNKRYTSFVGYFPADNPEVLVMVVIDSPSMAESWGSTVAGPIFKEIGDKTVRYLGLKPATIASKQ